MSNNLHFLFEFIYNFQFVRIMFFTDLILISVFLFISDIENHSHFNGITNILNTFPFPSNLFHFARFILWNESTFTTDAEWYFFYRFRLLVNDNKNKLVLWLAIWFFLWSKLRLLRFIHSNVHRRIKGWSSGKTS